MHYLHTDLLGSPIDGEVGSTSYTENFSPWGEKLDNPIQLADDIGFTGHQSDVSTGFTYMQARYYDPVSGRFMSADPAGFGARNPMSFNFYSYANNSPLRFVDPSGLVAFEQNKPVTRRKCIKFLDLCPSGPVRSSKGSAGDDEEDDGTEESGSGSQAAGLAADGAAMGSTAATLVAVDQGSAGGWWRSWNGQWYRSSFKGGGRAQAGSRSAVLTESKAARLAAKGFVLASVGAEGTELTVAAINGDGWGVADSLGDMAAIYPGVAMGPWGVYFSTVYTVTDVTFGPALAGFAADRLCSWDSSCL